MTTTIQHRLQRLRNRFKKSPQLLTWTIIFLLGVGIILRIWMMRRGHNFDMDSYRLVADIMHHGGNVYAETTRYNYGPIWFSLLELFDTFARYVVENERYFRYGVAGFLILVDIGIWFILRKHFGLIAAFLFFLNPISIIITGYHNQFDNLAILLALCAVSLYGKSEGGLTKRKIAGLALLGVSLMAKHVFFAFPLWLAIRQTGWREKLATLAIPIGVFLVGFLPYWHQGSEGIVQNVFLYNSFNNAPFWNAIVPGFLQTLINPKMLFFGALIIGAFAFRKRPLMEAVLLYCVVLVVFSSSVANQYLAIVVPAIAVFCNWPFIAYSLYTTIFLAISQAGLHSQKLADTLPDFIRQPLTIDVRSYDSLIVILAMGFLWLFYKMPIVRGVQHTVRRITKEVRLQLQTLR